MTSLLSMENGECLEMEFSLTVLEIEDGTTETIFQFTDLANYKFTDGADFAFTEA